MVRENSYHHQLIKKRGKKKVINRKSYLALPVFSRERFTVDTHTFLESCFNTILRLASFIL